MDQRLAALILLGSLSLMQTAEVPHQMSLTVLERGDSLTLICPLLKNEHGLFFWYKLKFGYMIETVAETAGTTQKVNLRENFRNSRFAVGLVGAHFIFNIRNVSKEDEATYFCQGGSAYTMKFINGTLLIVKDKTLQKSVYVKQTPETASVHLGDSVTFQCSLHSKDQENTVQWPDEHSVYWFRSAAGETPGIIYTNSDEQDKGSCIHNWSRTVQNSSDTGTYYCAVVTCGEILFGEGTKVETRQESPLPLIVVGVLLAFCVIVIAVLVFTRNQKVVCEHCKGETSNQHNRSAEMHPSHEDAEESVTYTTLDLSLRNSRRWKNNQEIPNTCVYSGMKDPQ